MKSKYVIGFWCTDDEFLNSGYPELKVEMESVGIDLTMDEAFKEVMNTYELSSVAFAMFVVYNQEFPDGVSTCRWDVVLENNVYSFGC